MTVCLVIIAIVLAQAGVGQEGHVNEPWVAWFVLVFVCIYIAAYAWSCKLLPPPILVAFLSTGGASGCVTLRLHPGPGILTGICQHACSCASAQLTNLTSRLHSQDSMLYQSCSLCQFLMHVHVGPSISLAVSLHNECCG